MTEIKELYSDLKSRYDSYNTRLAKIEKELADYNEGKSSIIVKTIGGNRYYYKQWRDGDKINTTMIDRVEPGVIAELEKDIQHRTDLKRERDELRQIIAGIEPSVSKLRKAAVKPDIEQKYGFEVYWKNELSARVSVSKNRVHVSRFIKHPVRQIFHADNISRQQLMEALRLRCFEEGRPDIQDKIKALGLNEYNPLEIVRKTHGVSYNDYIWIRFPGEKLRAEDVLVRQM